MTKPSKPADGTASPTGDWQSDVHVKHAAASLGIAHQDAPPAAAAAVEDDKLDRKQARELRDKYAERAYRLAARALMFWACVLAFSGWQAWCEGRPMWSDTVLIAITTGVTVSVLAAFLGVVRGIFGSSMK